MVSVSPTKFLEVCSKWPGYAHNVHRLDRTVSCLDIHRDLLLRAAIDPSPGTGRSTLTVARSYATVNGDGGSVDQGGGRREKETDDLGDLGRFTPAL